MEETVRETWNLMIEVGVTYGLDVVGAILILIIGWWIAGRSRAWAQLALEKTGRVDAMLTGFLAAAVRYTVLILTVLAVLDRFGVETTSFVAILGATGIAIGLALQGTLSNVAAGVMILLLRPFKVGDFIEGAGHSGTVKEVSLFVTHIATPDNVAIILPNTQLWNTAIKNFSFHATRRLDLVFGIGYDDDIDKAMEILKEMIAADERCHGDPEPLIAVGELADSSVNLLVHIWCASGDYWALKCDFVKAVKQRFDTEDISFPFPQRDVHLYDESKSA